MQERNLGHGGCSCGAKMGQITDQALHLRNICLKTRQALAKSDLVCEMPELLTDISPWVPADEQ